MLAFTIGEVSFSHACGSVFVEDAESCGTGEQREVTQVAEEFRMLMRVRENDELDDEFDIDNPAAGVLEIKAIDAVFLFCAHLFAHRHDISAKFVFVPCGCQHLATYCLKRCSQRDIASAEPGTRQCLMLPCPGAMLLVLAKCLNR